MRTGEYTTDMVRQSEPGTVFHKILKGHMTEESFVDQTGVDYVFKLILDDPNRAVFLSRDEVIAYMLSTRQECDAIVPWESQFPLFLSMAFQNSSPYYPFVRRAQIKLRESGPLQITKSRWIKSLPECPSDPASALNLERLISVFFLVGIGNVLSLTILVCEVTWKTRQRKQNNHHASYITSLLQTLTLAKEALEDNHDFVSKIEELTRLLKLKDAGK